MTIKEFLKQQQYIRKLRIEPKKAYVLVLGSIKEVDVTDDEGNPKPALKLIVRDRADGEVKAWTTSSMNTLDKLADLEVGGVFKLTQKSIKMGGEWIKTYDVEIIGKAKEGEMPTAEEAAAADKEPAAKKAEARWEQPPPVNAGEINIDDIEIPDREEGK